MEKLIILSTLKHTKLMIWAYVESGFNSFKIKRAVRSTRGTEDAGLQ